MNPEIIESIKLMVVNDKRLELPKIQIINYAEVKKVLIKAGGKYRKLGFDFPTDAQTIKNRLISGEEINDKKKFQFFPTPQAIAEQMVELACLDSSHRVLEPSAGMGDIAMRIPPGSFKELIVVEINPDCIETLAKYYTGYQEDFLTLHKEDIGAFDRIIANPPFTNNQDVDHVIHMYKFLNPGGRLVSIMSPSWTFGQQKKQKSFRKWFEALQDRQLAELTELDQGTFKESGTNVKTVMVIINKPHS